MQIQDLYVSCWELRIWKSQTQHGTLAENQALVEKGFEEMCRRIDVRGPKCQAEVILAPCVACRSS